MSYAYAKELDPKKIPIIDVSSLRNGSDKVSVAKKLHEDRLAALEKFLSNI